MTVFAEALFNYVIIVLLSEEAVRPQVGVIKRKIRYECLINHVVILGLFTSKDLLETYKPVFVFHSLDSNFMVCIARTSSIGKCQGKV